MANRKAERIARDILPEAVRNAIDRSIEPFIQYRADGEGVCSAKMRRERRLFAHRAIADLWELGFRIRKVESLSAKHVKALVRYWHEKGVVVASLHTRISMLKVMCGWVGKRNIVLTIRDYLPADEVRRCSIAKVSKAWEDQEIDPLEMIQLATQIDERFGVMVAMQHFFGLRVKESIELRPANAEVEGGSAIEVFEGTKGGRLRRIPIRTDKQREILAWARRVAESGRTKRIRWPDCTFKRAQNRFYHYIRDRLGISGKTAGVTAHGLRHGYAQRTYSIESGGLPCPVKGGAIDQIDRETHHNASITTTRELGHGRKDVTPTYYGSYGHQLRQVPPTKMAFDMSKLGLPSTTDSRSEAPR